MNDDPQAVDGASGSPSAPRPGSQSERSERSERSEQATGSVPPQPARSGIELAREALAQAREDARKRGSVPGQGGRRRSAGQSRGRAAGGSRGGDPQRFGAAIRQLLSERGWEQKAAVGGVFGNWEGIVGPELAVHTRPERFEDGELTVVADSTAWATQLRLLAKTLVRRLNEELGDNSVRRVKVVGPASAPRTPGAWRVRG